MLVHLNGVLLDLNDAKISPLDRGFIFGDGVYEGLYAVRSRAGEPRIVGLRRHTRRLADGLREMGISWDAEQMGPLCEELIRANGLTSAFVYLQVTRGTPGPNDLPRFRVPQSPMSPTVFAFCMDFKPPETFREPDSKHVVTHADPRWRLGHIKSISLAGNVIAALAAHGARTDDALFVQGDRVAEGTATNVVLVLPRESGEPEIVTPSLDSVSILAGVTRAIILDIMPEIVERPVTLEELGRASEVMLVGTTTLVASVTRIDDEAVGDGEPGPVARRMLDLLVRTILEERDDPA